ncbi:MAG: thiol oxidoreductase [Bacteroidales bacterium]|nr:thiol oxidoreductase [Bacteroidales bacterium]
MLFSCTKDQEIILRPNGTVASDRELSAGNATVFITGTSAYDTPAGWVTGDLLKRFHIGDRLYDDNRTSDQNDPVKGGLGPLYVGYSCGSCHRNAGRTYSTIDSEGGSGKNFSSILIYITRKNGGFFRQYGRVLHDQAIYGAEAEGKLHVTYEETKHQFHDGEEYTLRKPSYYITEWYADSISPDDLIIDVRIPLRHVGMGQIMSLDLDQLQELERRSNYPEYGISGKLNRIEDRHVSQIGVGGNKANHSDLTVELGFSSDLGVTNDRYPLEIGEGQSQMLGFTHYGIQISTRDMEDVDLYMYTLGVPARRNVNDPTVKRGEENFYQAKCHLCHTPTLHTRQDAPVLINGTRIPWLCRQTIHPYSDFLLHDMGPEMDSEYKAGLAMGCEWRTTPLWGIGLQQVVNGHTQFLHDGRARNFIEAIMWHGGEGAVSRELFARMSKEDRDALVTFLISL